MGSPHALLLPYPAQGHVIPLMELAHRLVDCGFMITFVNTQHTHGLVMAALSKESVDTEWMHLVSIPDGLPPGDNRNDVGLICDAIQRVMPDHLEELIKKTNESGDGDKITWMIVDETMAWALDVGKKTGLRCAAFWPACAGALTATLSIPKLIEDGILYPDGHPKKETFQLAPGMPTMNATFFFWNLCGDDETQQRLYNLLRNNNRATQWAEFIVCNSFVDVERPVFTYTADILPVGPLLTGLRFGKPVGHFWPEDSSCTAWLDEQPTGSVVYVAFGSFTVLVQRQFRELALGLDLCGRPFLWVVRPDMTDGSDSACPPGFRDRVAGRGRMVAWAPQQTVLAHRSIACFLSHCGWNSTMEGVTNGVPFLCWPYFADQLLNRDYICDSWRTGMGLAPDAEGIITKEEIKSKLDALIGDEGIKERAAQLKEAARRNVEVGGASYVNFHNVVETMKG